MTITWTRNGHRMTAEPIEGKAGNTFKESDHPRDRLGRFIETGAEVRIWGGALATVIGNVGGGRIEVQTGDGQHRVVHRNYLTVVARPDGSAPTSDPHAAAAAPATGVPQHPQAEHVPDPLSVKNSAAVQRATATVIDALHDDPELSDSLLSASTAYTAALDNGIPNDEADERARLVGVLDQIDAAHPDVSTDALRAAATAEPAGGIPATGRDVPNSGGEPVNVSVGDSIGFTANGHNLTGNVTGFTPNGGPIVHTPDGRDYPLLPDASKWEHRDTTPALTAPNGGPQPPPDTGGQRPAAPAAPDTAAPPRRREPRLQPESTPVGDAFTAATEDIASHPEFYAEDDARTVANAQDAYNSGDAEGAARLLNSVTDTAAVTALRDSLDPGGTTHGATGGDSVDQREPQPLPTSNPVADAFRYATDDIASYPEFYGPDDARSVAAAQDAYESGDTERAASLLNGVTSSRLVDFLVERLNDARANPDGAAAPAGSPARVGTIKLAGRDGGAGTVGDPVHVGSDIAKAAQLVSEGKHVRLDQPDQVATLVTELARLSHEAEAAGRDAPNFDMCQVTVEDTNLFCLDNKGLARVDMPQLSGVPIPGSPADGIDKDARGEVNLGPAFQQYLQDQGIAVTAEDSPASHLRATQREMSGPKIVGMIQSLRNGRLPDERIFVTRDGYVVDGHHRWAANVAVDTEDNTLGDVMMPVNRIDLDIGALLDLANEYTREQGMPGNTANAGTFGIHGLPPVAQPAPPGTAPLTDEEFQAHNAWLDERSAELYAAGQTSEKLFTIDPDHQVYTPERAAQQKAIVDELWNEAQNVPNEGRAVLSGGLGGAGKSTVLANSGISGDQFLTLNADTVKERMAAHGMIPEVDGMTPMEASTLVAWESSDIAEALAWRAYAERKNVVWDMTMVDGDQLKRRVRALRASGYDNITGMFVDISIATAIERTQIRHREATDRTRETGEGYGGRYVPAWVVAQNKVEGASSRNRVVFDTNRSMFDDGQVWENNTTPTRLETFRNDTVNDPTTDATYQAVAAQARVWAETRGYSAQQAALYASWYALNFTEQDTASRPAFAEAATWWPHTTSENR